MSILCLNYRGLSNPCAIKALGSVIEFEKSFIIFLFETKCFKNKMASIPLLLIVVFC